MADKTVQDSVQPGEVPNVSAEGNPWPSHWPGSTGARVAAVPKVATRRLRGLVATIEDEIIPRLVLSGRAAVPGDLTEPGHGSQLAEQGVAEFVGLLLRDEVELAYRYTDAVQMRGVSLQSIYLELLAPAARVLGRMWEEDACSFSEVTLALCRLHEILRALSVPQEQECPPSGRRMLLAPVAGEQHSFGLMIVGDCFRRAGWDVRIETSMSTPELLALVRHEWFTIVGLTVACDTHLEGVASAFHAIRKSSRNRALGVMVGGPVFVRDPGLAVQVGADATGRDGRHAVLQAENLVSMFARRC